MRLWYLISGWAVIGCAQPIVIEGGRIRSVGPGKARAGYDLRGSVSASRLGIK